MRWREAIDLIARQCRDTFARDATWYLDGAARHVPTIVDMKPTTWAGPGDPGVSTYEYWADVPVADMPREPKQGDEFELDGRRYRVVEAHNDTGAMYRCRIVEIAL